MNIYANSLTGKQFVAIFIMHLPILNIRGSELNLITIDDSPFLLVIYL